MRNERSECPLCGSLECSFYAEAHGRDYLGCTVCSVVFVRPEHRLSPSEERRRYEKHRNHPDDPAYKAYLGSLLAPLLDRLPPKASGLDFGCGPGPAVSAILREAGHEMEDYDPFFRPDRYAINRVYDFVVCTEVAEHFHRPAAELALISRLVGKGGALLLATRLVPNNQPFESWWYVRDPTHVVFYSRASLDWIAARWGWQVVSSTDSVHLFRRDCR